MTIMQHLEALRLSREGCQVVAYGDAMTQLVLRASHDRTYRREHLDQLCLRAVDSFRMMDATQVAAPDTPGANDAILLTERATTIVVRDNAQASEFLCVLCDQPEELTQLVTSARTTLSQITAGA